MKEQKDINGVKFSHFGVPEQFQEPGDEKIRETESTVDGYHFGDRMLEGVDFPCRIVDGALQVEMPDNAYTCKLNKEHWEKAALEYAVRNDLFGENELCLIMENGSCCYEMVQ